MDIIFLVLSTPRKISGRRPKSSNINPENEIFHFFLSKFLLWKCSFDTYIVNVEICLVQVHKWGKKQLLKNIPPGVFFSVHLDYCFETLAFFLSKSKNNSFKYQLFHIEIVYFFQHLFLEMLIWTVETPFRQPCQQIYGKNPK